MKIDAILAKEIRDSRNQPTLEVEAIVNGERGIFSVPSGASTGSYEAYELRDKETHGMSQSIKNIQEKIVPVLLSIDPSDQEKIDQTLISLDITKNKQMLGGNTMIGVSIAIAKAVARANNMAAGAYLREKMRTESTEPPFLYFNLINGGKHSNTKLCFQEYHIVPKVKDPAVSFALAKEIKQKLEEIITLRYPHTVLGDEGGYALDTEDVFLPLELLKETTESLGCLDQVYFALDVAASSFYDKTSSKYLLGQQEMTTEELITLYMTIVSKYPIISIEDPFFEENFEAFATLQKKVNDVLIIGDDLTVTNKERLERAIQTQSVKGLIIKPNQVGTLSETIDTILLAKANNCKCIISHRSGETMDDFIADLAYGSGAFGMKSGAPGPKERDCKYERLITLYTN